MTPVPPGALKGALLVVSALASYLITGRVRQKAIQHSMLDIPNERSSHSAPTPRGGGIAIATVSFVGIWLSAVVGWVPGNLALALTGGGILVAAIGFADDRRSLAPGIRFGAHVLAAVWALFWLGWLPTMEFGAGRLSLGWWGPVIGTLVIVWCTNLYNFMDGTDGIAGTEAVSCGIIAAVLVLIAGDGSIALLSALIAAASAGFLVWNWSPAKIFMGDTGSGLLGFLFACLAIASENRHALPLVWWMVLFLVFVFDATVTLLRRLARGERVYAAHREHGYQRAAAAGTGHAAVSLGVVALNLVLGVLAAVGFLRPLLAFAAVAISVGLNTMVYMAIERRRPMFSKTAR